MSNLAVRALTAVVALPLLGLLVLWERRWGFAVLVFLMIGLALCEYTAITLRSVARWQRVGVIALGVALSMALYFRTDLAFLWVIVAVILVSTLVLFGPGEIPEASSRLGLAGFGILYLGGLATALALLQRDVAFGPFWVFVAVAVSFTNDTGAYFAGRTFGGPKLYPVISPNKTISGAVGGLVAGLVMVFLARATFFPSLTVVDCLLVGIPAAVLGPIGDLVESMIKRSGGVKDSGHLIPGHGGALDRIDALMFVGAWVYAYAAYLRVP